MNAPASQATPQTGRPAALGHDQRKRIITLLTAGCSRRAAARSVGCAPSTIANTARRDSQFADDLALAESNLETDLLDAVRNAAKVDRYWRAASWLLERQFPLDYAANSPNHYPVSQVVDIFQNVFTTIHDDLTPEQCDRAIQNLTAILAEQP